ncbi:hypothetical protein Vadar_000366 [Vaccinium darrowii]|uniref:Uncharacterized protein n=1 Tax=Vaccinium darrowii TaxID=229202 RepID=A0ACB7YBV3_9ERIC|nr:hypothetical protein Vadar_000366 [Vaccinium darrowii]
MEPELLSEEHNPPEKFRDGAQAKRGESSDLTPVAISEVSDLCLGKPPLRSLPASAIVNDAVSAIKSSSDELPPVVVYDRDVRRIKAKLHQTTSSAQRALNGLRFISKTTKKGRHGRDLSPLWDVRPRRRLHRSPDFARRTEGA